MAALSVYLDTSVLVPLFLPDPFAERAKRFLGTGPAQVVVSDFVAAEYSSIVGIRVRIGALTQSAARMAFSNFDNWCGDYAADVETEAADIRAASLFLRRLDLTLRTPDAISLAIAQRLGANLATFDSKMSACAGKLGIPVVRV
jgi:predicted nucleic acid-binding protein